MVYNKQCKYDLVLEELVDIDDPMFDIQLHLARSEAEKAASEYRRVLILGLILLVLISMYFLLPFHIAKFFEIKNAESGQKVINIREFENFLSFLDSTHKNQITWTDLSTEKLSNIQYSTLSLDISYQNDKGLYGSVKTYHLYDNDVKYIHEDEIILKTNKFNKFTINGRDTDCSYVYNIDTIDDVSLFSGSMTDDTFYFKPTLNGEYSLYLQEICGSVITQVVEKIAKSVD